MLTVSSVQKRRSSSFRTTDPLTCHKPLPCMMRSALDRSRTAEVESKDQAMGQTATELVMYW